MCFALGDCLQVVVEAAVEVEAAAVEVRGPLQHLVAESYSHNNQKAVTACCYAHVMLKPCLLFFLLVCVPLRRRWWRWRRRRLPRPKPPGELLHAS